jgi:hypothetical protein
MVWGITLIVLGSLFLLERAGMIDVPSLGTMWPAVFGVIALARIAEGQYGSAVTFVLLGAWFFACEFGWYGLDYGNSWPLVMIAVGAGIVVRALGNVVRGSAQEGGES